MAAELCFQVFCYIFADVYRTVFPAFALTRFDILPFFSPSGQYYKSRRSPTELEFFSHIQSISYLKHLLLRRTTYISLFLTLLTVFLRRSHRSLRVRHTHSRKIYRGLQHFCEVPHITQLHREAVLL